MRVAWASVESDGGARRELERIARRSAEDHAVSAIILSFHHADISCVSEIVRKIGTHVHNGDAAGREREQMRRVRASARESRRGR